MCTELLDAIRSAGASDIEDILQVAIERKRQLFPDWEILYLAIPKNNEEKRKLTIDYIQQWCRKQP